MINELIEQIGGRERLEALASFKPSGSNSVNSASRDEWMAMARALLAVLDAKPVGITDSSELGCLLRGEMANVMPPNYRGVDKGDEVHIYTTPPAASVPEGYKLVPIEPSKEMLLASKRYKAKNKVPTGPGVYRAMIAAAPAPGGDVE